jgi:prepilin-type processing-associated H-X9-DG protein
VHDILPTNNNKRTNVLFCDGDVSTTWSVNSKLIYIKYFLLLRKCRKVTNQQLTKITKANRKI